MEGTPFGKYRLVALLGRGGMGEVWQAFDTATDRTVALKVLPAHLADDEMYQTRFRREARAAAGLSEPHVVPIHGYGEIDGRLYVDMRLIVGRDLEEVLREGPMDPARAVMIVEQIASALHAAHQIGLVHRDIKPSNILVTDDDFAYLIDFGIARAAGETGLTSTGATVGTWAYMAPERFQTGTADARADTYSLACVLYQSLTGKVPFPGHSLEQIAVAHMLQPPPQPSALQDEVPAAMDGVIATGMAKDPDQRYPTTKDLALAARAALTTPIRQAIPHPPRVSAPTPETQSAEPQPQGAITGSSSSATSDTGSGPSSVDAVPKDSNAEKVPSRDAPQVPYDPAADTRTHAGPTVSASDSPTQQAPISASDDRIPIPRPAAFARLPVQEPGSQRLNRRSMLLLLGVVAILIVVSVAVVVISIGSRSSPGGGVASPTSTTTSTTRLTTAPPVAETALDGLLLSPEQVNTAMGATEMTVTKTHTSMSDDSATMAPKECLAIDGSAQAQVYADSGYTALRDQTLQEGNNFTHYVQQAVVFFPSAKQAGAFFTASRQQWSACHQYTHLQSGSPWSVGPISNANGTLSTTATQLNAPAPGWACGRALTVRNNVVIDVNTCSANPTDTAINIANQIAAKVPE